MVRGAHPGMNMAQRHAMKSGWMRVKPLKRTGMMSCVKPPPELPQPACYARILSNCGRSRSVNGRRHKDLENQIQGCLQFSPLLRGQQHCATASCCHCQKVMMQFRPSACHPAHGAEGAWLPVKATCSQNGRTHLLLSRWQRQQSSH